MGRDDELRVDMRSRPRRWTQEEDLYICKEALRLSREKGSVSVEEWNVIASRMCDRKGKAVRERWENKLVPGLSSKPFTSAEHGMILSAVERLGHEWRAIAATLPGRSPAAVKNYWYSYKRRMERREAGKLARHRKIKRLEVGVVLVPELAADPAYANSDALEDADVPDGEDTAVHSDEHGDADGMLADESSDEAGGSDAASASTASALEVLAYECAAAYDNAVVDHTGSDDASSVQHEVSGAAADTKRARIVKARIVRAAPLTSAFTAVSSTAPVAVPPAVAAPMAGWNAIGMRAPWMSGMVTPDVPMPWMWQSQLVFPYGFMPMGMQIPPGQHAFPHVSAAMAPAVFAPTTPSLLPMGAGGWAARTPPPAVAVATPTPAEKAAEAAPVALTAAV